MNYLGTLGLLLIFFILLNKFLTSKKIFLDPNRSLSHKSFLNKSNNVPFSGGILILISCLVLLPSEYLVFKSFLILVFMTGILSDIEVLRSPTIRIIGQTLIVGLFLIVSETLIKSVRIELLDKFLEIYQFKLFFTVFCLLILINGTNFLDGLNTLVSIYYILVILSVLYLRYKFNFNFDTEVFNVMLMALLIFFIFNFFGKVYLGDNGSYLIPFIMGITLIEFSNKDLFNEQTQQYLSPYFVACLLWYPAFENLFSIIRKRLKNISPAEPDNKHLHQLIFIKMKEKLRFKDNVLNTFTGIIINLYNLLVFLFSINYFSNTKMLLLILFINVLTYTLLYYSLKKGSIAQ